MSEIKEYLSGMTAGAFFGMAFLILFVLSFLGWMLYKLTTMLLAFQ